MPIWDYNDKFYFKINDIEIKELPGDTSFQKDVPYIMDITFRKYDFRVHKKRAKFFFFNFQIF